MQQRRRRDIFVETKQSPAPEGRYVPEIIRRMVARTMPLLTELGNSFRVGSTRMGARRKSSFGVRGAFFLMT